MKTIKWIVFLGCLGVMLSACTGRLPTTQEIPLVEDLLPPGAAVEIQNQVSEALGVSIQDIQIKSVEQMDWLDSCLGLGGADEVCEAVITPGWLVVVTVNGDELRYRVNETGTVIRQEP